MIPVNIISGFLGSGKTTAIIKLLQQKAESRKWAIIINEFGKISIDSQTLTAKSDAGSVYDISGGCICCSAKGYFRENLDKIIGSGNYERIIIEPSGLGGVEMISEIIEANAALQLMPVICIVDINSIGNERIQMNFLYKAQISKADLVVFSKCDLLPEKAIQDQLVKKFMALFPEKLNCLCGTHFEERSLFVECFENRNTVPAFFTRNPLLTDMDYQEISIQLGASVTFNPEKVSAFFKQFPSVIRAKGHLNTENGWQLFNLTLSASSFEACMVKDQNEIIFIAQKSGADLQQIESEFKKIFAS